MSRAHTKSARKLTALVAAGLLSACIVDKSDIAFVDDDEFVDGPGGGADSKAGTKNNAGSDTDAGEGSGGSSNGGSKQTGGSKTGGSGGTPGAGTNPGGGSPPTGGMGGGGGGVPPGGYPCPGVVRPMGSIATFDGLTDPMESFTDASMALTMGFYTYPPPPNAPLIKLGDDKLTIEAMVSQPTGVGMWMSACVDAMAANLTRLVFELNGGRGDGQPLMLRVGLGINETKFADPQFQTGGCVPPQGQNMVYCRPAGREVMVPVMGMPQNVSIPFSDFRDGSPITGIDPKEIVSIEWGFIYLNGEPAYGASITIDNVRFQ